MSFFTILWKKRKYIYPWKYKGVSLNLLFIVIIYGMEVVVADNNTNMTMLYNKRIDRNRNIILNKRLRIYNKIYMNNITLNDSRYIKIKHKQDNLASSHRKTIFARVNENKIINNENRNNKTNVNNRNSFDNKPNSDQEYTSSWVVKIPEQYHDDQSSKYIIDEIVHNFDLISHGTIGHLIGHFLLVHHSYYNHSNEVSKELQQLRHMITNRLKGHPHVEWVRHEVVRKRFKRALEFQDQFFPSQWHLDNIKFVGHDINVTGVWERNITGNGVTVSVIDDGVEWTNPDILDNYSSKGSWDLNSNDEDPMPRVDDAGLNHHGTRCAGEIAAVANEYCAVGVAFGAKVSGIRILDGPMTDSLEAMAFNTKSNINDIYSCSWGPDDNGRTVDGPHQLAQAALARGVMTGRHGYGSIFVVASGNGGHFRDNCNFDGYANSIFTVTIGAVDELNQMPYYAEHCAAMLAVTYSSGQGHQRNIVTTDWRLGTGTGCTDRHTGTSAAAPLAAGVIALMLEARSCLAWRDIQHLIVYTSVRVDIEPEEWQLNAAGFAHSHKHGFGLLDSWRLVTAAKIWPNVPFMTSWSSRVKHVRKIIPNGSERKLTQSIYVADKMAEHVTTLEHVTLTVNIKHPRRGTLAIVLISPYGTVSRLASTRKYDKSTEGFTDWTFSTVRCWGERPIGLWKLIITDKGDHKKKGVLVTWRITFYGSSMSHQDIVERKRLVRRAVSGKFLNEEGPPCPLASTVDVDRNSLSPKVLKIILLLSGFFFLVALYFIVDVLCSTEVKEVVVETDLVEQTTMEIQTPDGFDLESFIPKSLAKDDEVRLSNIIEHGQTSCSFAEDDFLMADIERCVRETPDEITRVKEFEERLKFALEQSLILQMKQSNQIDNLEHDLKELLGTEGIGTIDVFEEKPKKSAKKKLKGILKKPKKYDEASKLR